MATGLLEGGQLKKKLWATHWLPKGQISKKVSVEHCTLSTVVCVGCCETLGKIMLPGGNPKTRNPESGITVQYRE